MSKSISNLKTIAYSKDGTLSLDAGSITNCETYRQCSIDVPWKFVQSDGSRGSCEVCGLAGDLLCCDKCPAVYHIGCVPNDHCAGDFEAAKWWLCPPCVESNLKNGYGADSLKGVPCAEGRKSGQKSTDSTNKSVSISSDTRNASSCLAEQESKVCALCEGGKNNMSQLLLCDICEAEYHMYCLSPTLDVAPKDDWICPVCVAIEPRTVKRRSKVDRDDFGRIKKRRGEENMLTGEKVKFRRTCSSDRAKTHTLEHLKHKPTFFNKSGKGLLSALLQFNTSPMSDTMFSFMVDSVSSMTSAGINSAEYNNNILGGNATSCNINPLSIQAESQKAVNRIEIIARLEQLKSDVASMKKRGSFNFTVCDNKPLQILDTDFNKSFEDLKMMVSPSLSVPFDNSFGTSNNSEDTGPKRCLGCQKGWNHVCLGRRTITEKAEEAAFREYISNNTAKYKAGNEDLQQTKLPKWAVSLCDTLKNENDLEILDKKIKDSLPKISKAFLRTELLQLLSSKPLPEYEAQKEYLQETLRDANYDFQQVLTNTKAFDRTKLDFKARKEEVKITKWGCNECQIKTEPPLSSDLRDSHFCSKCDLEFHKHCMKQSLTSGASRRVCKRCDNHEQYKIEGATKCSGQSLCEEELSVSEIGGGNEKLQNLLCTIWKCLVHEDAGAYLRVLPTSLSKDSRIRENETADLSSMRRKLILRTYKSTKDFEQDLFHLRNCAENLDKWQLTISSSKHQDITKAANRIFSKGKKLILLAKRCLKEEFERTSFCPFFEKLRLVEGELPHLFQALACNKKLGYYTKITVGRCTMLTKDISRAFQSANSQHNSANCVPLVNPAKTEELIAWLSTIIVSYRDQSLN